MANLNILFVAVAYLVIGYLVTHSHRSPTARFMSAVGWPIEVAQRMTGDRHLPYLFLLPNMLIFGLYTFAPLFMNVGFSLTDGQFFSFATREFSGLDNYYRIFSDIQIDTGDLNVEDDKFYAALGFTFTFVIFQVPIMVLVAMFTAVVLNRDIIARGFWRAVFFYPVMLSPVVVGFLWQLILKRQGVLSQVLMGWGWIEEPIQWLTDPSWTMFWSILVYTWAHLGFYMLILLAGLQSIPGDLYEAAEMDGTPAPRVFRRITLPLLLPILLVVTVLSLIKAFQAFEELLAMEVGWISIVRYIFETSGLQGFRYEFGLGIAAAASLTVALILIVLSMFQFYLTRRETKL
ncbi:ABC transporter permease [Actibacterium mucosum KCTC 23349]|uniref:ABC transporter permease n=1 Tax=Actibacterium mucosum KCTC 23349 TaxID=1454373 RepID=A0A037ZD74_9RHOB|nr:sugar ABC transporter permease [Actibacterium mucosum]KAJ54399.1 ABC transporter permease [Actibacterium mucosum KCTC 23349]